MSDSIIHTPATILLAEQNREESRTIQGWLETYGYRVQTAKDRKKILSAVPMLSLVLLSTDFNSSLDVCRELKSSDGFLPLILLANGNPYDIPTYLDAGADEVITPPLDQEILIAKVRAMLRLKQKFDELEQRNQELTQQLAQRNREADRMLRETRDLQVLKDTIVRNVSHELRTPMLQIKSAVAMLADDARSASPDGVSTLADHATAATAKLESIVQNITQLATSLNVKMEPFHVADAINAVTRVLQRQWALSGDIDRIKMLIDDVPPVIGDRGGVVQVLRQLLDNALKFSPKGGDVEIIVNKQDDNVCIAVRDYGIGIAKAELDRIFQAFYQVDGTERRAFGGTGVGLSIVKLLLDGMGSTIQVESKPNKGSRFSFLLPIATPDHS